MKMRDQTSSPLEPNRLAIDLEARRVKEIETRSANLEPEEPAPEPAPPAKDGE